MSRVLALAAAGMIVLTGCIPGPNDKGETSVPVSPSAPATAAPPDAGTPPQTGTTAPPQTAAPAAPAGITFGSAREAADHLITAWRSGDRNAALQAAGPNTVAKVFALPAPAAAGVEGCDPGSEAGDASYAYRCHYLYEGGSSHLWINAHTAAGWRVENFTQSAD
ncbi:hypothetical protein [Actinocorallia populi]|uniref:hypothetical protein n=1 Tax=Actinocorallia populi TaxID=2079200 RepID=UPI000D091F93|nr:hypothetical protein [Actinocorallia populi]